MANSLLLCEAKPVSLSVRVVGLCFLVKKPLPMGSSKWISREPCAPDLLLCLLIAVPCERCQDRGVQLVR